MKLTVLVDNNTLIDRYFLGEPGVSYHIEDGEVRVLFDLGYTDVFLTNGEKMGLDLLHVDFVALSHAHLDHTWGLEPYMRRLGEEIFEGRGIDRPQLVAHPDVFSSRTFTGTEEIGIHLDPSRLARYFDLGLSAQPVWLTERLVFLGEIPRVTDFESRTSVGHVLTEDGMTADFMPDDTALCYRSEEGLVIITGCSHAGIVNIIEHAKAVCGDTRIRDVIGGFHLLSPSDAQLRGTCEYFARLGAERIHPCHCTDLTSRIALSQSVAIGEVGVGLVLEY